MRETGFSGYQPRGGKPLDESNPPTAGSGAVPVVGKSAKPSGKVSNPSESAKAALRTAINQSSYAYLWESQPDLVLAIDVAVQAGLDVESILKEIRSAAPLVPGDKYDKLISGAVNHAYQAFRQI